LLDRISPGALDLTDKDAAISSELTHDEECLLVWRRNDFGAEELTSL
jgi:hypothetical protein